MYKYACVVKVPPRESVLLWAMLAAAAAAGVFCTQIVVLGCDKTVCQTEEKANTPDNGCIYIHLCNYRDLFLSTLVRITTRKLIFVFSAFC